MSDILSQIEEIQGNVRDIKATWGNTIMTLDNIKSSLKADRQKAIDEAYQNGYEVGQHEATTLEYQQGLDDAWVAAKKICTNWMISDQTLAEIFGQCKDIDTIMHENTAQEAINKLKAYEQQKADEIKVGDIITDGKINYLVINITDKSYVALQGTDFEPAYIGKDYIKSYHNLHDSKDMRKITEEINKVMKGEQQESVCITCRNRNALYCDACVNDSQWQPKGDAE